LWLLAELARGRLLTGFPWVASGYAYVDAPLVGLAPYVGVYGIGALAVGGAAWIALGSSMPGRQPPRRAAGRWPRLLLPGLSFALLWGLAALLGRIEHTRPAGSLQVTLLQTNVAQDEKFVAERLPQTLAWLGERLQREQGDLVIAPETAVPLLPDQLEALSPGYWEALQAHFHTAGRAALLGLPLGDFSSGYTNSVAGLGLGTPYRYDKQHLVPFGEFIPPGFRWFVDLMQMPLGDFSRGPLDAPSFAVRDQRVAPNVCYEDLFGEELAVRFVEAARAPTILANVSNIGWFGDTVALTQHLNISRMRSLELQRPMLRATNTGVTAFIDHRGHVAARMEPFSAGALSGLVQGRDGVTPYAAWAGRFGLWPLGLGAGALVALLAFSRRRLAPSAPADPAAPR
jgi:apolipoprotein N-acyltransferase